MIIRWNSQTGKPKTLHLSIFELKQDSSFFDELEIREISNVNKKADSANEEPSEKKRDVLFSLHVTNRS